jgi:hypothetical protein
VFGLRYVLLIGLLLFIVVLTLGCISETPEVQPTESPQSTTPPETPAEHFSESPRPTITPTSTEQDCFDFDFVKAYNVTDVIYDLWSKDRGEPPNLYLTKNGTRICDNYEATMRFINKTLGENGEKIPCGSLRLEIAHTMGDYVLMYFTGVLMDSTGGMKKSGNTSPDIKYYIYDPNDLQLDIPIPLFPRLVNNLTIFKTMIECPECVNVIDPSEYLTLIDTNDYLEYLGIIITEYEKVFEVEKSISCEEYAAERLVATTDDATSIMS